MHLKQYLSGIDPAAREALALACGSTLGHIRNVMYGYRPCSAELAAAIERHSARAVTRPEMRPDDWHEIWPELAESMADQAVPGADRSLFAIKPDNPAPSHPAPVEAAAIFQGGVNA